LSAHSSRASAASSLASSVPAHTSAWQCERDATCRTVLERHWPSIRRYDDVRDLAVVARQLTFSVEAIRALHAPELAAAAPRSTPTSPDGSLPWPDDYAHDGWSARMFLHQTLSTSHSDWLPSDTESLLSHSTLAISPLRVAGGSSLSDVLLPTAPDSPKLYLTQAMVTGLLRRARRRRRPLQRVLLRIPHGWRRRTVTCTSQGEGFVYSIPSRQKLSRDSPEAGLMAFLAQLVSGCLETPSTFAVLNGSESES
jgi:hypothetical protein